MRPPATEPDEADETAAAAGTGRRSGRRPGRSRTRDLIADAARHQFGDRGYDRTSIRSVAGEAGVDPALVVRFYGSKEELFHATITWPFVPEELLAVAGDGPRADLGLRLAHFIVATLQAKRSTEAFTALVRAATSHPDAARLLRERLVRDVFTPLARSLGDEETDLRAALCMTQTTGLVFAWRIVGVEALADLPPERIAQLVAPTLQHYLTAPL